MSPPAPCKRLMNNSSLVQLLVLFGFCLAAMACGTSMPRKLVSVTVTPAVADAQSFPGGQVQFVATGIFNKPPSPVTPLPDVSSWSVTPGSLASIDQTGLAKCAPGQSGIAAVEIALVGDSPVMNVAKLICP
jgi:hypothetical protein